jgi:hypothetical protein
MNKNGKKNKIIRKIIVGVIKCKKNLAFRLLYVTFAPVKIIKL